MPPFTDPLFRHAIVADAAGDACVLDTGSDLMAELGPASVTGAAGPVLLGSANGTPCTADTMTGQVTLTGDVGGVTLEGATISGPARGAGNRGQVTVSGNTVGGPAIVTGNTGAALVAGNGANGALSCSGNNPAPTDEGKPNTSNGPATGQCSGLT
jgi:hypothetical protein